jgi:hypothetical protein
MAANAPKNLTRSSLKYSPVSQFHIRKYDADNLVTGNLAGRFKTHIVGSNPAHFTVICVTVYYLFVYIFSVSLTTLSQKLRPYRVESNDK